MKKLIFTCLALIVMMVSCGPPAEQKEVMIRNAKRTSDSIANVINMALSQATEGIVPPPAAPPSASTPASPASTIAPPPAVAPSNTAGKK